MREIDHWLSRFWNCIGGLFRHRDRVKVRKHKFPKGKSHHTERDLECQVQKTWFHVEQPHRPNKWNLANAQHDDHQIAIHVDAHEKCEVHWFSVH